jgi:hypothetical protein
MPRQQFIDLAQLVTVDDGAERGGQIGKRIPVLGLQVSTSEATVAQFYAPVSWPAKSALLGRVFKWCALKSSGLGVARRSGMKKQGSRLHANSRSSSRMWRVQSTFKWTMEKEVLV